MLKVSMKTSILIATAVSAVLASTVIVAHHSIAVFDMTKNVAIEGTVTKFSYTNPHGWIDIAVPNAKGGTDTWSLEMGSAAQLRRSGWTPETLKAGDKVKAVLHPRRDGTLAGNIATLTFEDGTPIGGRRITDQGMGAGGMGAEGMGGGAPRVAQLSEPAHPLLKDLVPKMMFGFYKQPGGPPEGEMTPPSADPKNFAGRYYPNEATVLLPGETTRMLPYTDAGAKAFLPRAQDFLDGKLREDVLSLCKPAGVVRVMNQGFLAHITQTADQLNIIYLEDHLVRRIYINQEHPKDLKPSFMGHSVGKWEGNTLVVDTIGFRDGGWMDEYGSPSSDKLRVTERISKQPDGTLKFDMTFEDPTYYSKPVSYTRSWAWNPTVSWDEVICEENNRDAPRT